MHACVHMLYHERSTANQRWKYDYKFAWITRLNKVIFDKMLSNFGLTATFRAKLSILITLAT